MTAAPRTAGYNRVHPQCPVEWISFKGDTADLGHIQPSWATSPSHPSQRHCIWWALQLPDVSSVQNYCCAKANNTPSISPATLAKAQSSSSGKLQACTKITGCNSLAWVERMIDLGIAELPCDPGKPWIALWSLWLYTVLQSCLFFPSLLFTTPVAVLSPSWVAA